MAPKARGSVVDNGGGKRAELQRERKKITGPKRHGPHAAAALKAAAAASETPAERNERSWRKQRTVDPMDADESGVSQLIFQRCLEGFS